MKYKLSFFSAGMIYLAFLIVVVCFWYPYTNISGNESFWVYLIIFTLLSLFAIYLLFVIFSFQKVNCKSVTIDKSGKTLVLESKKEGQVALSSESIRNIEIFAGQVVRGIEIAKIKIHSQNENITYTCIISNYNAFATNLPKNIDVTMHQSLFYKP